VGVTPIRETASKRDGFCGGGGVVSAAVPPRGGGRYMVVAGGGIESQFKEKKCQKKTV